MTGASESNLNERPAGDSSFPRRIGAAIAHFFQPLPCDCYPRGTLRLQEPAKIFFAGSTGYRRSLWRAQFAALAGDSGLDSRDRFVGHDALAFVRQTPRLRRSIQLRKWDGENETTTGSIRRGGY